WGSGGGRCAGDRRGGSGRTAGRSVAGPGPGWRPAAGRRRSTASAGCRAGGGSAWGARGRASGPPGLPVSILSTGKGPKNQRCEEKVGRPRRPEEQGLIYPWLTAGSRCDKPSIPQSCTSRKQATAILDETGRGIRYCDMSRGCLIFRCNRGTETVSGTGLIGSGVRSTEGTGLFNKDDGPVTHWR